MFTPPLRTIAATIGVFLLAAAALPNASNAQTIEWRGFGYISDFSEGCTANGWFGRSQVGVRFRPSNIGSNGPSTRISFFEDFYATNFVREDGRFDRRWRVVRAGGLGSYHYLWDNETRLRVRTQSPANNRLSATTPQIRLVGNIRGFDNVADCNVAFEATVILRR